MLWFWAVLIANLCASISCSFIITFGIIKPTTNKSRRDFVTRLVLRFTLFRLIFSGFYVGFVCVCGNVYMCINCATSSTRKIRRKKKTLPRALRLTRNFNRLSRVLVQSFVTAFFFCCVAFSRKHMVSSRFHCNLNRTLDLHSHAKKKNKIDWYRRTIGEDVRRQRCRVRHKC